MILFKDASFWGPMFGFLTAMAGLSRWLIRAFYISRQRANIHEAQLAATTEKIKLENSIRMLGILQTAVAEIKPTLEEHTKQLEGFRHSFDLMQTMEQEATAMMKELKTQYWSFNEELKKFLPVTDALVSRVNRIETEILELKKGSGNIYVTTKK